MFTAVTGLVGSSYQGKVKEIDMETLAARREKLDMQQTYKIIRGKEDVDQSNWFNRISKERPVRTRLAEGRVNLEQHAARLEIRRNFYSQRVVAQLNRHGKIQEEAGVMDKTKENEMRKTPAPDYYW